MTTTDGLTDDELTKIEREHPEGLSSDQIVLFLARGGVAFTHASLRKYVQLGLLPRSRRVAVEGKARGSLGLYPAIILRRIQRLRSLMGSYTIEEIQREFLFVRTDVEELEGNLERIFTALGGAAKATGGDVAWRELSDARSLAADLVAKLASVETRLTMQARLERDDAKAAAV
jgi:hypothetical protein